MNRVITSGRFSAGLMFGIGIVEISYGVNAGYIPIGGAIALILLMYRSDQ